MASLIGSLKTKFGGDKGGIRHFLKSLTDLSWAGPCSLHVSYHSRKPAEKA